VDRKVNLPTTDLAYYAHIHSSKVGSVTYVIHQGVNPCFIFQAIEDANDSDYIQMRTEDGIRSVFRAKGTQWTGFCNLGTGAGAGLFVVTGADLGALASGIPANLQKGGVGSGVVIVANDNINKPVVMYYVAATKKLTFMNIDGEKSELTLA